MKYLFFSILLTVFILPIQALSFTEPSQLVACSDGDECNFCQLVQTIDNITEWIGVIALLIAVILFMYAGYKMTASRGDISMVTDARKMMGNVAVGLLIIIIAWTLVDTLLKTFTGGGFGIWNNPTECGGQANNSGLVDEVISTGTHEGVIVSPGTGSVNDAGFIDAPYPSGGSGSVEVGGSGGAAGNSSRGATGGTNNDNNGFGNDPYGEYGDGTAGNPGSVYVAPEFGPQ